MGWQVAICLLIAVLPAAASVAVIFRTGKKPPKAVEMWATSWKTISPFWLLGYRSFVFIAMCLLLAQTAYRDGALTFFFYTQWTFTLVIIYFAIGIVISAHGCWEYSREYTDTDLREEARDFLDGVLASSNVTLSSLQADKYVEGSQLPNRRLKQLHEKKAGFWGYLMLIVYQTSAGAVVLTDVVFWALLVPFLSGKLFRINLIMFCMHSLNAVFLLIDTALNCLPFPWFGMAFFVLWSCVYVTFQWVLHACGLQWWPYPFMDLSTPWAPLWYVVMALVHIPCFAAYYLIAKAKHSFSSTIFPNSYVKSQ